MLLPVGAFDATFSTNRCSAIHPSLGARPLGCTRPGLMYASGSPSRGGPVGSSTPHFFKQLSSSHYRSSGYGFGSLHMFISEFHAVLPSLRHLSWIGRRHGTHPDRYWVLNVPQACAIAVWDGSRGACRQRHRCFEYGWQDRSCPCCTHHLRQEPAPNRAGEIAS